MRTYRDHDALNRLARTRDPFDLHLLIQERLPPQTSPESNDLAAWMSVIVMDRDDTPLALEQQLGFSILHNRWNGLACDHPDFTPSWDAFELGGHWYVLTFILNDDGFGIVVFVPRTSVHELTALCDRYAREYGLL